MKVASTTLKCLLASKKQNPLKAAGEEGFNNIDLHMSKKKKGFVTAIMSS